MPRLKITQPDGTVKTLALRPDSRIRIGRAGDNEAVLDDPRSSRVHAIVERTGDGWVLTDMGSRNGTRLNGRPVSEAILRGRDKIQIGKSTVLFESEASSPRSGKTKGPQPKERKPVIASRRRSEPSEFSEDDFDVEARERERGRGEPQNKGGQLIIVVLALIVAAGGFFLVQGSKPVAKPLPSISLPTDDPVGFIPNGDSDHGYSAVFTYIPPQPLPGQLELKFKAFDIDTEDEVQVYLNGQVILALEPTGDGIWSSGRTRRLPTELFKPGQTNYIVFQHNYNRRGEPATYAWGVSDVEVSPVIILPCDLAGAKEDYRIGKNLWENRRVATSNLHDSIERFRSALAFSKSCEPKPVFYIDLSRLSHEADAELDEAYRALRIEFIKARKLNRVSDGLRYLSLIEQLIPDSDDPRRIEAQRWKRSFRAASRSKNRKNRLY